jgi:hypothetical protein
MKRCIQLLLIMWSLCKGLEALQRGVNLYENIKAHAKDVPKELAGGCGFQMVSVEKEEED